MGARAAGWCKDWSDLRVVHTTLWHHTGHTHTRDGLVFGWHVQGRFSFQAVMSKGVGVGPKHVVSILRTHADVGDAR